MTLNNVALKMILISCVALTAGCSTRGVVDGTVNTAGFVTKTAINGTIGAGKLVARGLSGGEE